MSVNEVTEAYNHWRKQQEIEQTARELIDEQWVMGNVPFVILQMAGFVTEPKILNSCRHRADGLGMESVARRYVHPTRLGAILHWE